MAALLWLGYSNLTKLSAAKTTQDFIAALLLLIIAVVLIVAAAFLIYDGWKALRAPRKVAAKAV